MLIAGFDAGQTHTRCRLQQWKAAGNDRARDNQLAPQPRLVEGEGSGVSHLDAPQGEARFHAAIRSSLEAALHADGLPLDTPLDAAVMGASGIEQGTALQARGQHLLSTALNLPETQTLVTGDERTALHGAFPNSAGIVLISGTGMICLGRNAAGDEHRCGGWGWRLDGAGSAFDIGHQGLQLSLRMADGRVKETPLRKALWSALDCSNAAAIKALAAGTDLGVAELARLAPLVHAQALAGDGMALQVIEASALALADAVTAVARALKLDHPLISAQGGAINHLALLHDRVDEHLNQNLGQWSWMSAGGDACDGALTLARELLSQR